MQRLVGSERNRCEELITTFDKDETAKDFVDKLKTLTKRCQNKYGAFFGSSSQCREIISDLAPLIKDALSQLVVTKGHEVKNHEPIVKDTATFIYNAFKTTDEQGESTSVTNAIMMTSFFSADDKTPTTKYESASAYSQMSQYLRQVYKDPANVPTISAGITATVQDCPLY